MPPTILPKGDMILESKSEISRVRGVGLPRTLVMLPESTVNNPASRARCYALVDKLAAGRDITVLGSKEHRDRIFRFLLNSYTLLTLFPLSKAAGHRVTLFAQRGTKFRTRVDLLLFWKKITESKLLFDFDDAIFIQFPRGTQRLCHSADVVVAANEYLAGYARRFSNHVFVVPTPIDLGLYQRPATLPVKGDVPVIGWIGTSWNLEYLRLLVRPLQRLHASNDFVLTLVTDPSMARELELPADIPLKIVPWTLSDFIPTLATFDIGVYPLPDDPWTRGKSGYKVLEYMALGIPAVASPVGEVIHTIDPGVDGLLAATEEDWYIHLRRLLEHPELRETMGRAGRKKVESRFSLDAAVKEIEKRLDELDRE